MTSEIAESKPQRTGLFGVGSAHGQSTVYLAYANISRAPGRTHYSTLHDGNFPFVLSVRRAPPRDRAALYVTGPLGVQLCSTSV